MMMMMLMIIIIIITIIIIKDTSLLDYKCIFSERKFTNTRFV
jgi:hypothetical protein